MKKFRKYIAITAALLVIITGLACFKAQSSTMTCNSTITFGTYSTPYVKWGGYTITDIIQTSSIVTSMLYVDGRFIDDRAGTGSNTYNTTLSVTTYGIYEPYCGSVYEVDSTHEFNLADNTPNMITSSTTRIAQ